MISYGFNVIFLLLVLPTVGLTSLPPRDRVEGYFKKSINLESISFFDGVHSMIEFESSNHEIKPSVVLNARGLNSPMPLLVTKKKLCSLSSGQILQIDSSDPDSRCDISKWCERTGNTYLGEKEGFGYISFFIKKK
jgi:tRNA 2-thiouridine synthesizing protein A